MARQGGFFGGLLVGLVLLGAGVVLLRNLPPAKVTAVQVRDRVIDEISGVQRQGPRALPELARTEDCRVADVMTDALQGTVRPVQLPEGTTGDWTFATPEARLDELLGATRCRELGDLDRLSAQSLRQLVDVLPRVAMHSHAVVGGRVGRAWSQRTWALGHEVLAGAPRRLGTVGADLAEVGAAGLVASLTHGPLSDDEVAELQLVVGALLERGPEPRGVLRAVGADTLERGLTAAVAYTDDGEVLAHQVEVASAWWRDLGNAAMSPGAELPEPPRAEDAEHQKVLDLLVDPEARELAAALRRLARARRVLQALLAAREDAPAGGCATPWTAEPARDPVTGSAFGWNAEDCTLTLDSTEWPLGGSDGG